MSDLEPGTEIMAAGGTPCRLLLDLEDDSLLLVETIDQIGADSVWVMDAEGCRVCDFPKPALTLHNDSIKTLALWYVAQLYEVEAAAYARGVEYGHEQAARNVRQFFGMDQLSGQLEVIGDAINNLNENLWRSRQAQERAG